MTREDALELISGRGGTQTSGGSGGSYHLAGGSGSELLGGDGVGYVLVGSGGGGGGYYGGGAGGIFAAGHSGGGGGGSGFAWGIDTSLEQGDGGTPANADDEYYIHPAGVGGTSRSNGEPGLVVIIY